ncbi:metallophosphoesterase [Haladaptatus caseinilyticus]|uniref:metallophosphoesterase n=1 Tax=Haladaptatus caseinilyticus TaxID=2993314 RepID=UPI00224A8A3A|nr:metallophosphoesterase [Haladaptatus caseinilyticus]
MSEAHTESAAESNQRNAPSATRRQTLAFVGGLGGLGFTASHRTAAQRASESSEPTVDSSTEFSVAIFPDTQYYAQQDNGIFEQMGQWVADNKEQYNIQMFLHEGDIVQSYGSDNDAEWDVAQDAIGRMDDANIPTVLSLGNHDADNIRDPQTFRSRFPATRYKETKESNETILDWGTFEGYAENAYFLQEIHGEQFLFLTLEFGPRDAVLKWAGQLLETYAEATAFLVTHTYTYHDGTRTDANDNFAPNWYEGGGLPEGSNYNNGEQMWQSELRYHENLANVHSGHHITGSYVARRTAHAEGNRTTQMFMDYQTIDNGGDGWFRLLTVNTQTYNAEITTYSPYLDKWSDDKEESFKFNLYPNKKGA